MIVVLVVVVADLIGRTTRSQSHRNYKPETDILCQFEEWCLTNSMMTRVAAFPRVLRNAIFASIFLVLDYPPHLGISFPWQPRGNGCETDYLISELSGSGSFGQDLRSSESLGCH
jgi:hypothetical protein